MDFPLSADIIPPSDRLDFNVGDMSGKSTPTRVEVGMDYNQVVGSELREVTSGHCSFAGSLSFFADVTG